MNKRGLFIGLTTIDIQYFVDSFPGPNVKMNAVPPTILVGGPSTNAAVAFSFLGGEAFLLSATGKSSFSTFIEADFLQTSVHHIDLLEGKDQLPLLASVITSRDTGGRNVFTSYPAAGSSSVLTHDLWHDVNPAFLFLDGFHPEISIPAARQANSMQIPVIFDGGSWKPHLPDLLPWVDIAICSADFKPPGISELEQVFQYLKNSGVGHSVITRGEEAVLYQKSDQTIISQYPVPKVPVIDTLGAGDFFHGAFSYYYAKGLSVDECIRRATILASKTCECPGTRDWLNLMNPEDFR